MHTYGGGGGLGGCLPLCVIATAFTVLKKTKGVVMVAFFCVGGGSEV